jgi:putative spermidine/putrescine transport system permease protein
MTSGHTQLRRGGPKNIEGVAWLLLAPAGILIGVLIAASLLILRISFGEKNIEFETWTIANYLKIGEALYWKSILLTLRLAFASALIAIIIGYPIALYLARTASNAARRLVLFVLLLPMLMNLLLQSFGWIVMLSPTGVVNQVLMGLGITSRPILLLFNEFGVLAGLVQTVMPLAVLPITSVLRAIPTDLEDAAATLGASRLSVFWHIILPLSFPGILAASLLIFAYNASAFVVPLLIGGRRVTMLALLIRDQMGPLLNWPFGAANAVVLILITLIVLASYQRVFRKYQ